MLTLNAPGEEQSGILAGSGASSPEASEARVTAKGGQIFVDGKPFFPIGLYLAIWWDEGNLKQLRKAGFNLIGARGKMDTLDKWRQFLDGAHRNGFKAWVDLWYGWRDEAPQWWATDLNERTPKPAGTVAERVNFLHTITSALSDHPALLVWSTLDEINIWWDVPIVGLLRGYKLLRQIDPKHPVWVNFTGPMHIQKMPAQEMLSNLKSYAPLADIVSFDLYPYAYGAEAPPDIVGDAILLLRKAVGDEKPVWAVLQADHQPAGRFPTEKELRFMTYDVLACGATGILFFGQDVSVGWSPVAPYVSEEGKKFRKALFRVVGELKTLAPALLGADDAEVGLATRWSPIRFRCKVFEGQRYLIAVNRHWKWSQKVRFEWRRCRLLEVEVMFDGRKIAPSGNAFEDELPPFGARVYRVKLEREGQ